eukprot:COSAG06_NODE_37314_length_436_cov_3.759644_1_plen_29_part_10
MTATTDTTGTTISLQRLRKKMTRDVVTDR